MKRVGNALQVSPSDLITFLESPFASWMDRYHLEYPDAVMPGEPSESERLVAEAGNTHERDFLERLFREGREIREIPKADTAQAEALTVEALASSAEVIFQARLRGGLFAGWADFLVRSDEEERAWEVWDTKLARKMKAYFILQLCAYADMLEQMTGERPRVIRAVLGDNTIHRHRTEDMFDYYLETKERFLRFMEDWTPDLATRPEPDPAGEHRLWTGHAEEWLESVDHLSLVARISRGQRLHLERAGIRTLAALATAREEDRPRQIPERVFTTLREQAALQKSTRERRLREPDAPAEFRVLQPEAERPELGLGGLPPADPADLFFDLEGYPLVPGGLEYLWGVTYLDKGQPRFRDWWAHDAEEERTAFERFVDWAHARWLAHPGLHIYHYANYEIAVLKRLMSRHGSREEEVDDLLRNGVFIDLYKVVKEGLRVGERSYSIKYIERLYRSKRTNEVATAGDSIVQYGRWISSGEGRTPQESRILKEIRDYNKDDCDSTLELADWLRSLQAEAGIEPTQRLNKEEEGSDSGPSLRVRESIVGKQSQLDALAAARAVTHDPSQLRLVDIMSDFVDFFRRDAKPIWWRLFDRLASTGEELFDDIACIGRSTLVDAEGSLVKSSLVYEYRFDPAQDTKVRAGDRVIPTANRLLKLMVESVDPEAGRLKVKVGLKRLQKNPEGILPRSTSWIPDEYVGPAALEVSLNDQIDGFADTGYVHPPIRQFLLREAPPSLRTEPDEARQQILETVEAMSGELLCIQGPPGTGKSTIAAEVICRLVESGQTVGLSSGSHKAIQNLLEKVAQRGGGQVRMVYKGSDSGSNGAPDLPGLTVESKGERIFEGRIHGVVAGTPWLFARPDAIGRLDTLFVDEAGQMSAAHLIAMGRCARNIILLGDQMQLEQVSNAIHPNDAGDSCLQYYLNGARVIPRNKGVFLPVSYRMQPDLCRVVSEIAYEGQLMAQGTEDRRLSWGDPEAALPKSCGLLFHGVEHDGNVQASEEEAEAISGLTERLLRAELHGLGSPRRLVMEDILYVAPYNMQVNLLRSRLPEGARIASVDKFQGQEAAVVILSMCSSFGEYGSRGIEFILNRNRLNVALSRAQMLAIVVGDPRIAQTTTSSIERMAELSTFARIKRS